MACRSLMKRREVVAGAFLTTMQDDANHRQKHFTSMVQDFHHRQMVLVSDLDLFFMHIIFVVCYLSGKILCE